MKYMEPKINLVLVNAVDVITASQEVDDNRPGMGEVGRG